MVGARWILNNPAHAAGGYGIFEFPVGVALEVEACGGAVLALDCTFAGQEGSARTDEKSFTPW